MSTRKGWTRVPFNEALNKYRVADVSATGETVWIGPSTWDLTKGQTETHGEQMLALSGSARLRRLALAILDAQKSRAAKGGGK